MVPASSPPFPPIAAPFLVAVVSLSTFMEPGCSGSLSIVSFASFATLMPAGETVNFDEDVADLLIEILFSPSR